MSYNAFSFSMALKWHLEREIVIQTPMSSGQSGSFNLSNTQTHMDMYDCYSNIKSLLQLDFIAVIFNEFAENYAF